MNCKTCINAVNICDSCDVDATIPRYLKDNKCVLEEECIGAYFWDETLKECTGMTMRKQKIAL